MQLPYIEQFCYNRRMDRQRNLEYIDSVAYVIAHDIVHLDHMYQYKDLYTYRRRKLNYLGNPNQEYILGDNLVDDQYNLQYMSKLVASHIHYK